MKILFLYMFPLWGNGSGAWLRKLAKRLARRKHEVAIVCPEKRKLEGVTQFRVKPSQMGVFVGHPELKRAKKYEEMTGPELAKIVCAYIKRTAEAAQEFHPQIIHCFHTAFLPLVGRLVKVMYPAKMIITTHGSDLHYLKRDRRFIGPTKDAIRATAYITANSTFTRQWFIKMFGKKCSAKLRTIPAGVELKKIRGTKEINRRYQLDGKKVVLFTGRLTVHKGVKYLVKAARKIKGTVVILGDGPERPYLKELIKKYELKNVLLLGYIKEDDLATLSKFYYRADVYVAPSVWDEPLGMVILEAMAAETPVICTRKGGVMSIVKDGYNGFLVRPRNSSQIAQMVNKLLANDSLREKMGERARKTVEEKFTWEKVTDKFERIYKKFA